MKNKLRVGAVSYLNAKPLVWGLERLNNVVDLCFEVPSRLHRLFEEEKIDVALLPSISCIGNDRYRIIPDISISSNGMVKSVNLFVRTKIEDVKEVALDKSSMTSRALVTIILQERYGLRPQFVDWDNGLEIARSSSDAVLLIGDDAMKVDPNSNSYTVMDMGMEWHRLTHLPFVFALWVTRTGIKLEGFDKILKRTKEAGLRAINEIAATEARRLNLDINDCIRYLSKAIIYDLGESEIKGLERFYNYAIRVGLLDKQNSTNNDNDTKRAGQGKGACIEFYED